MIDRDSPDRAMKERTLTLAEIGARTFKVVIPGEQYCLKAAGLGLALDAYRVRWERGELLCQLRVSMDIAGVATVNGVIDDGSMNCSSLRARSERAKHLTALMSAADLPLQPLIQELCLRVLSAESEGEPSVSLRDVQPASAGLSEEVFGIPVLREDSTLLVGKGGDGKSLLALQILAELTKRGHRTGFADSEWNEQIHHERLSRLCGHPLPDVQYLRLGRPLSIESDRLRRFVHQQGLDFLVIDSVGTSVDAPLETSEAATNFMRVVRGLGRIGTVLISHVKHDNADAPGPKRPFGSVYWMNMCRAVWHIRSTETATGLEAIVENVKANRGRKGAVIGLRFTFGERFRIERITPTDLEELSSDLPVRDRIAALLQRRGALPMEDIATDLEVNRETVKKAIQRGLQKQFVKVVTIPENITKYGLIESRLSA